MIQPVTLTADELTQVIQLVAPSGIEYQAARICRMLAEQHSVQTVTINSGCSVGNISDVVNKAINPRISKLGLYIACMQPPRQILNKFNQPSGQVLWGFYRDMVANDPAYHQEPLQDALTGDSGAIRDQMPDQHAHDLFEAAERSEAAIFDQNIEAANQLPEADYHACR